MLKITKNTDDFRLCDISSCKAEELLDINEIEIDKRKAIDERVIDYVSFIGNPYMHRVGDIAVKISFSSDSRDTFKDLLMQGIIDSEYGKHY